MCLVKTPKLDPATNKVLEPTVIRNPYLDGLDPQAKALRKGRSSLRIERRGAGGLIPSASPVAVLPPNSPDTPGIFGVPGNSTVQVGGVGGGGRISRNMGEGRTYER